MVLSGHTFSSVRTERKTRATHFPQEGISKMNKITKDKITGFTAIIFGVIMIVNIIPNWVIMSDTLNHTSPDTFPKFASYALILLGISLVVQAVMKEHKEKLAGSGAAAKEAKPKWTWKEFSKSDTYCILATAVAVLMFDLLLKPVGYIVTGCVCSIFLLVAFRSKKWYHYAIVIAFTFLLYFVFGKVLLVKMP